ncbi:MAG: hypothetical protein J6L77_09575 [Coprococcus sp.]|nr:hypothetical protein [Coprococcus sp.]
MKRKSKKQKIVKAVLSIVMLFIMVISNTGIADYPTVEAAATDSGTILTITCSKTQVDVGETITVCVDFNAPYDQKTGACYDMLMFRLAYNDDAMKLESYSNGSVYSNPVLKKENDGIYWEKDDDTYLTKSGTLLIATFTVLKPDCKFYFNGYGYAVDPRKYTFDDVPVLSKNSVTTSCSHSKVSEVVTKQPTCNTDGTKEKRCTVCNEVCEKNSVPATGHTAGEWTIIKEATCEETGEKEKRCTKCNIIMETETISATGHTAGEGTIVKEATCKETGSKEIGCTVCKKILDTKTIPVLAHSFGDWTVSIQATVDAEGEEERVCSSCGEKETRAIPKLEQPTEDVTTEEQPTEDATTEEQPTEDATTEEQPTEDATTEEQPTEDVTTEAIVNNNSPKTGDTVHLYLVMGLLFMSLVGLGTISIVKRQK